MNGLMIKELVFIVPTDKVDVFYKNVPVDVWVTLKSTPNEDGSQWLSVIMVDVSSEVITEFLQDSQLYSCKASIKIELPNNADERFKEQLNVVDGVLEIEGIEFESLIKVIWTIEVMRDIEWS